ncbi:acyltransferase family protein [Chelativorans salis]|uniref:Acyltransferase n=1 Tax=Chelativorans salis TaxID=2978478 RepID=A0ABT2LUL3_9HYPH|nr:acyltransferase family protein [Chelativorans sp. EGI FJ00035]MCT7378216.1 acyltransferase [Chelativorans sp. EGI FJ00035]
MLQRKYSDIRAGHSYREDIDGLRALAVVPVVLYHAGLGPFSGGFVGVDVFFVISGFLITGIITGEIERGDFSVIHFYERRARRLLPALFAVLITSFIAGWFLLIPSEFSDLSHSATATLFFSSNLFFWNSLGYFSDASEFHPLLHTWSLAVEEQFYLLFPLALVISQGRRQATQRIIISIVLLGSLVLSIYAVKHFPEGAFYLLPTRAWELMCGALLATHVVPSISSPRIRSSLSLAGVALILVPMLTYTSATPFPGLAAIPPCIGTMLIIYCGRSSLAAKVLSTKPLVWIGLISYSLYLWHWPILSFLRIDQGSVHLPIFLSLSATVASFAAAYISWNYIERPFRVRTAVSRRKVFQLSGMGCIVVIAASTSVSATNGFPVRYDRNVTSFLELNTADIVGGRCAEGCPFGVEEAPPSVVLWGDSHANALTPALDFVARQEDLGGIVFADAACAPLLDVHRSDVGDKWKNCAALAIRAIDYIRKNRDQISTVVLSARWALAATGKGSVGENSRPAPLKIVSSSQRRSSVDVFRYGLERTVSKLNEYDIDVVILGGVPEIGWHVPKSLARAANKGMKPPRVPSLSDFRDRNSSAEDVMLEIAVRFDVHLIDLAPIFCSPKCKVVYRGKPIYRDDDHLSHFGAHRFLGPPLSKILLPKVAASRGVAGEEWIPLRHPP